MKTPSGGVEYLEPASHCTHCRCDFFPAREGLKLDEREFSPELLRKLAETAARVKSFEAGAELARIWSGVAISSRQLGRVAEAVGAELVAKRDAEVDDFAHHHRHAEGADPHHESAAVFVDGGRADSLTRQRRTRPRRLRSGP